MTSYIQLIDINSKYIKPQKEILVTVNHLRLYTIDYFWSVKIVANMSACNSLFFSPKKTQCPLVLCVKFLFKKPKLSEIVKLLFEPKKFHFSIIVIRLIHVFVLTCIYGIHNELLRLD